MNIGSRWGWGLLTATAMIWLLWMTLSPDNTPNQINLRPMAEHGRALTCLVKGACAPQQAFWFLLVDVIGNIIVFVPLGAGLAGILPRANLGQAICRVTLVGFLFSLTIELTQLAIPTRATDIDDLIFNTVGVTMGALLFILLRPPKPLSQDAG
ncbi:MAG: VanZ family protein [Anaerolineae bacterium]|nr:VanZ family protein [Anaerolineae bacterium]